MKKGFTSVIIVNYKTRELTANCISSVLKHFNPAGYEIILVDNASADGSVEYFREQFPGIFIIANEKNLGFGGANNIGAKKAAGEFVFFLNPDTIVLYDVLKKFVDFYNGHRHLKTGALGSLLVSEKSDILVSFGPFTYMLTRLIKNYRRRKNSEILKEIEKSYFAQADIVLGANLFSEKAVFDSFGGFDTNIFLYEEEFELQYRMRKAGFVSLVINEKAIIHLEGKSSGSWFKRKNSFLSLCYIFRKHLPYHLYLACRIKQILYALVFFKNHKTTWKEKRDYLKLSIFKK